MATAAPGVNVTAVINRGISSYQIWIFVCCFLISLVDGLDSQIMSVTGPMVMNELKLERPMLGSLLSASQWGALVGAFGIGFFADRWGRRQTLIICGLVFSVMTLITAWADSFNTLFIYRIITGLGIGGALPCFVALATEYAPEKRKASVVAITFGAVPFGGIVAGLLGANLAGSYTWQEIFIFCGVLSIAITLLIIAVLPESLSFMITRNFNPAKIRAVLSRLAPGENYGATEQFIITEEVQKGAPVRHLFTEQRGVLTVLLWVGFFIAYLVLIGTLVWTPTLMKQAGMSQADGSLALMFNNVGGIVGIVVAGQIFDRFRRLLFPLLTGVFLLGAAATAMLGYVAPNVTQVYIFSTLAGLFIPAGLGGIYVLAALIYPTFMRSTGVGWGSGFGRVGSSMGPVIGGLMFAAAWGTPLTLATLGAIALVNVVCVVLIGILLNRRNASGVGGAI
jgi:AAHS family 4-hydroxybenzoate transporter-like MFS transporter